jgi:hypothetical protein
MTTPLQLELPPEALEALVDVLVDRIQGRIEAARADAWIGVEQIAEYLDCKPQRVYDLWGKREHSGFPGYKDGGRLLSKRSLIDQWLERGGCA